MQVTCPGCHSRFVLPDGVKDGARLRCSVCKEVFVFERPKEEPIPMSNPVQAPKQAPLPEDTMPRESALPELTAPKKRGGLVFWLVLLLLLCVGFVYAYRALPEFRAQIDALQERVLGDKTAAPQKPQDKPAAAKPAEEALVLEDVRQYYVDNSKVGSLLVVEGYVVNNDQRPCKNIHVQGAILKQRQVIDSREQRAGVRLSNTQLRVMSEAELWAALENEQEQDVSNAYVAPGARVPFTMVFMNAPAGVDEYTVRVGTFEPAEEGQPAGTTAQPAAASATNLPAPAGSPAGAAPAAPAGAQAGSAK